MSTPPKDIKSLEGRKFRFVVSSAEDAAKIIKERLGESARVLSVKQVNGKGLTRFLSAPQLEIIVTVPPSSDEKTPEVDDLSSAAAQSMDAVLESAKSVAKAISGPKLAEEGKVRSRSRIFQEPDRPITEILDRAGFDNKFLLGLRNSSKWGNMQEMTLSHGLAEVAQWMRDQYKEVEKLPLTSRVAFFGLPGVGTTTALCKKLASEVFILGKTPQVVKLENDMPNADDALRIFCEVLGVPILKDPVGTEEINPEKSLYLDLPGCVFADKEEWINLKGRMDEFEVDSRVLVINAAHDLDVIKDSFRLGDLMGATHVVFTNLDQVTNYAKLWPFILHGRLPVLFLSHGQNITSDLTENPFDYLVHRTFPPMILN